jgi:hypothetical protein
MKAEMAPRDSKRLWILASVTYGLVILTTIFAIWAYYHLSPQTDDVRPSVPVFNPK